MKTTYYVMRKTRLGIPSRTARDGRAKPSPNKKKGKKKKGTYESTVQEREKINEMRREKLPW